MTCVNTFMLNKLVKFISRGCQNLNLYLHIFITITNEIHIINPFFMLYYLFKGTSIYFYNVVYLFICISNLILLC